MRTVALGTLLALLPLWGAGHAFEWTPFEFPDRDQAYTLEIWQGEDAERPEAIMEIDVTSTGEGFDVVTNMRYERQAVDQSELEDAIFGAGFMGMFTMGPMMMFGPFAMMLPMLLGEEDIRVRSEPIRVMGVGRLHMDREVEVAGRTCVVVRLEPDNEGAGEMEFALAEGVPFPCYSRYGSGADAVEVRLVRIE